MPEAIDRWHELLLPTPRTALDEELTALAEEIRKAARRPRTRRRWRCANGSGPR